MKKSIPHLDAALRAHKAGLLDKARSGYKKLLANIPDDPPVLYLLGVVEIQRGNPQGAIGPLSRSIRFNPKNMDARNALAAALVAVGRHHEAIAALRAAIEIEPQHPLGWRNLGSVMLKIGDAAGAEQALRKAIALDPKNPESFNELGLALRRQGRAPEDFLSFFEHALSLSPRMELPLLNLLVSAREMGDMERIGRLRALCSTPGAKYLADTALPPIPASCEEIDSSRARFERALDEAISSPRRIADPLGEIGQSLQFYLAYHDRDDRHLQVKLAQAMKASCPELTFVAPHCRKGAWMPGRRLRVGVFSSHLRNHTIGKLHRGTIRGMPRDRFEIIVISPKGPRDDIAKEINEAADGSLSVTENLAAARMSISEAKLDILFYPDIGMEPFTYFMSFARLAPLQVTTWGHPISPGTGALDWFFSAETIEPPDGEKHYEEKLALLSRPSVDFTRPVLASQLGREHFGLPEGKNIYLCPQTLFKFHPDFDSLISSILRIDQNGVMVAISGQFGWHEKLRTRIAIHNPDIVGRIIFLNRMTEHEFIALCALSNVILDIPSFSGGNTTLEALSAGAPIVHMPGRFMRGRLTGGFLKRAGLDWGIADGASDYANKAVEIARDPEPWRQRVRANAGVLFGDSDAILEFSRFLENSIEAIR
jgi:protein O-GlcNAc transferase